MTQAEILINEAPKGAAIARGKLINKVIEAYPEMNRASLNTIFTRLIQSGRFVRVAHGEYIRTQNNIYIPEITQDIKVVFNFVQAEFPLIDICLWSTFSVVPLMQHIPSFDIIIFEVEKEAIDPVFDILQSKLRDRRVLLNPSLEEYHRYGSGFPLVIVRPILSQAPLIKIQGIITASMEKILVDLFCDPYFPSAKESEYHTILQNAFERHEINSKKLLRYASRRGKREELKQLLKSIGL